MLGQGLVMEPQTTTCDNIFDGSPLSLTMNTYLVNNSGNVGYLAVQGNKGRIICVDNELCQGMMINRKLVLAHSSNIMLRKTNWIQPNMEGAQAGNRDGDAAETAQNTGQANSQSS